MNPTASSPLRVARTRAAHSRGFSLVEVMVATVIALAASLAIFQSFSVSEGYRRAATSGGDATFSGAMGAFVLEQDLSMAGYGINTATYLGCPTFGFDTTGGGFRLIAFTLAPALIIPGGAATIPDQVTILASSTSASPGAIPFSTGMPTYASDIQVANPFGIFAGDAYVLAQAGQPFCVIGQAMDTPTGNPVGSQNTVRHGSGTYKTTGGANAVSRYNLPFGWGPPTPYGATSSLIDLGGTPIANTYHVTLNTPGVPDYTLVVDQAFSGQTNVPVAGNIVQLKAFYGRDTVGAGNVTIWDQVTPVNNAQWAAVLAVRVAIAARSAQPERPAANGACTTTTVLPQVRWEDGTLTVLDVSATPNWQCYHYKLFRATSSLRNQIWTPA